MQQHFLTLDESDKPPYELKSEAQIEPVHPEDPEEIYRMRLKRHDGFDAMFDAVFFPDRVEIRGKDDNILLGEIPNEKVNDPVDLAKRLNALKPHIIESMDWQDQ